MHKHLDREMDHLKQSLMLLTASVEETVQQATRCFREKDAKGAQAVIEKDTQIDQMEIKVEEECLKLLALYQPVARDLRSIITILKINNDLERIGDLAVNISKCSLFLIQQPLIDTHFQFATMIEKSTKLLKMSFDCLVNLDTELAYQVTLLDDEIDSIKDEQEAKIMDHLKLNPDQAESMIRFISVSRYLERIADHATNIAEDVIYSVNGDIIRHSNPHASQQA